ncbi:MAG TPA: DNA gyrase inhibitor YacG [Bradyrhizobium sp.]|nr:DNA gyrase inhibitor YacG [Bradyrhizobium sp.]
MPVKPPGTGGPGPQPKGPAKPCPECGKPANPATLPFCSPRCRDVDLNRWLSGSYVIPGRDDDEDAE